jgi:hypothetical protein
MKSTGESRLIEVDSQWKLDQLKMTLFELFELSFRVLGSRY